MVFLRLGFVHEVCRTIAIATRSDAAADHHLVWWALKFLAHLVQQGDRLANWPWRVPRGITQFLAPIMLARQVALSRMKPLAVSASSA